MLEKAMISGVAQTLEETVYRVRGATAATLFDALAEPRERRHDRPDGPTRSSSPPRSRTVRRRRARARRARTRAGPRDADLGKVSVVGAGMKSHPGVAATTFATLRDTGSSRSSWRTSPIKIACYMPRGRRRARGRRAARGLRASSGRMSDSRASSRGRRRNGRGRTRHARSSSPSAGTTTCARSPRPARRARRSIGGLTWSRRRRRTRLGAGELDVCLFSVGTDASRELVPHAVAGGAVCIDKSAAFRLEAGIPLVVARGERRTRARARRDRREPELLRDPARLRAEAAPRRGRPGARAASPPISRCPAPATPAIERLRREPSGEPTWRWTGRSTATSSTRSRRSGRRRARSSELPDLPLQRDVRARAGARRPRAKRSGSRRRAALAGGRARDPRRGPARARSQRLPDAERGRRARRRARRPHPAGPGERLRARPLQRDDNLRKGAALNAVQIAETLLERRLIPA